MQFHSPSVVQEPLSAAPEPVVPVEAGVDADAVLDAAGLDDAFGLDETTGEAGAEVTAGAEPVADGATVAKTPPGRDEAFGDATADEAPPETLEVALAAGEETLAEDEPPEDEPPVAAAPAHPEMVEIAPDPILVTAVPGLGNPRSAPSAALQEEVAMLATNMLGRASKVAWSRSMSMVAFPSRFVEPAPIVMGAQFMYISRLPTLLNHVQARVASPAGRSGTGKV